MGRIPSVESISVTKYGLNYIRPRHREIARRLVAGQNHRMICAAIGMSEDRFSIIINSPLFKIELKKLEDERDSNAVDIAKDLKAISPVALDVIERTMYQARKEDLRFKAAESILDRAGYGAINKSAINISGSVGVHEGMTNDELRKMVGDRIERMKQEAETKAQEEKEAGAIDVEFENVGECSGDEQDGKPKVLIT